MLASERFIDSVLVQMRQDIKEAFGNEVFWSGKIDEKGTVVFAKVGARGNEDSVIVNNNIAREGHVLIHNHPSGILRPSEADQNIAYNCSDTSMGFYIVDNSVENVYAVVEPVKPRVLEKLNAEDASFYLSKNGPLSKVNEYYEERPAQLELVKNITAAFNENKIGIFEAGTGVGKSFAYLIPALMWAQKNKERVIVSTGTINLQQQLFEKDIPLALKLLKSNVKSVLFKGRQNYLCFRRLEEALEEDATLFEDDTEIIKKIDDWAKTSATGSKSDLSFMPSESVWSKVNSESDACFGGRCPHREKCFVMKVRKEAADANLIVVNHHLLFADIESRMAGAGYDDTAVLPPYKHIVFDEAHGIEDSATSFFSETFNKFKLMKQVNLLYRTWRGSISGFLVQASVYSNVEDFTDRCYEIINDLKDSMMILEDMTLNLMQNEWTLRIYSGNSSRFVNFFSQIESLKLSLLKFTNLVREVLDGISDEDKDVQCVWETKTVLHRLDTIGILLENFSLWQEKNDLVFWLQRIRIPPKTAGGEPVIYVHFIQTPLNIAPMMVAGVFEPMKSVICTSATLRTENDFNFWSRRVGISLLDNDLVLKQNFDSPFNYKENVVFAVPNDAPFPDSQYFQGYVESVNPVLIEASEGRTLVLFTSYDMLRWTFDSTKSVIEAKGIKVYKQGDEDRFKLLEKFKNETESVLFATDSFWEGVDVPGKSLSQVIIVKLPFAVPSDPVFAARSEAIEAHGGNSFMHLSVPQSVIKFRQGFGRLVRRGSDKGAVVVLDRRIVEKRYGSMFTNSVPVCKRLYCPIDQIVKEVKKITSD